MKTKRFTVWDRGHCNVSIRDGEAKPGFGDVVAVFPTMGGQWATYQSHADAIKMAKKMVKFMNGKA